MKIGKRLEKSNGEIQNDLLAKYHCEDKLEE
jgi:hypothetical protein